MTDDLARLTRISVRAARHYGASAAVYANASSFDVMTERWRVDRKTGERRYDGLRWIRGRTADAYRNPATLARQIRREMRAVWA